MTKDQTWDVTGCERLGATIVPEWVKEMREHYLRTGFYRPEDIWRLLGDPTGYVRVGTGGARAASSATDASKP